MAARRNLFFHLGLLLALIPAGCGSSSSDVATGEPRPDSNDATAAADQDTLPPIGYGTLRQDDFTVKLLTPNRLEVKLTPLDEGVIRLAAPDTYQRLHSLVASRESRVQEIAEKGGIRRQPLVFLVSFFTYDLQLEFEPTDVQIISRGILYRPLGILPLTPTWGSRYVQQQQVQSALYVFDPSIDLQVVFQLEYVSERSFDWNSIIQILAAERGRVYARARS